MIIIPLDLTTAGKIVMRPGLGIGGMTTTEKEARTHSQQRSAKHSAGPSRACKEDRQGLLPEEKCEVSSGGGALTMINTRTGKRTIYRVAQQHKQSVGGRERGHVPLSDKCSRDIVPAIDVIPLAPTLSSPPVKAATTAEKTGLPFSRAIAEEVPPPNFKVPKFNVYDPKSDAPSHVQ